MGKKINEREKIIQILTKEMSMLRDVYGVRKLALFGSYAKRTYKKTSDIDILVEFEKPLGLGFVDFANHLEKILGRQADILTPEGIKNIRIKEIARDIKRSLYYVQ